MDTDRNLLFGVLALQMDFISRDALVAAMNAWAVDKGKTLGQILIDQGRLTRERLQLLDALVAEHLRAHADDPQRSLAALHSTPSARRDLQGIGDADLQASLAHVTEERGDDPELTTPHLAASGVGIRFQILRPLAKGGLGEVFIARDTEVDREVALKEIQQRHADHADNRARFLLEAKVTGALEHPGIVPVYGLGTYADGRPFYAMRFIKGDSLKDTIAAFHAEAKGGAESERSRKLRQLLGRFVDVCQAIAYAHSRGVLHRDLKPGNVMLGKYGETLVVDWGLAKVLGHADVERTDGVVLSSGDSGLTQAGKALGTPAYMSPEQAAGRIEQLGPRSDVYSLGATLYCLLTGQAPFTENDAGVILAKVQKGDFPPPRRVNPRVPAALEAVCLKAMALKPEDRYGGPQELAEEVERWLADEPVRVYRDSLTVRAARWGRHHRTPVVATAVLLVSAVAALGVSTVLVWREQQQTKKEKLRAETNLSRASVLSVQLLDLSERLAPIEKSEPLRNQMTQTALQTVVFLLAERPDDPDLREKAAKLYRFAANLCSRRNATAVAGGYYRESIRLAEELVAEGSDGIGSGAGLLPRKEWSHQPVLRDRLAETLRDYAGFLTKVGQYGEAEAVLRQAFDHTEKLRPIYPGRLYRRTLASCLLAQGANDFSRGRFAESVAASRQAADLYGGLLDAPPEEAQSLDGFMHGLGLNRSAAGLRELGRLDEARAANAAALDQARALVKQDKADNDAQHLLGLAYREQGRILAQLPDRQTQAEASLGQAIGTWDDLQKRFQYPRYRESQALAYLARGQLRATRKDLGQAEEDLETARLLVEQLVQEAPAVPAYLGQLGRVYGELGRLALARGEARLAVDWLTKASASLRADLDHSPESAPEQRALEEVVAELRKARARLP
jgi:serine/threonine protein kinase